MRAGLAIAGLAPHADQALCRVGIGRLPGKGRVAQGPVDGGRRHWPVRAQPGVVRMARPRVGRRLGGQAQAHRMQVQVHHAVEQVPVGLHQGAAVPPFPQGAAALMPVVEMAHVAAAQRLHHLRHAFAGVRRDQQMEMVVDDHPGVQGHPVVARLQEDGLPQVFAVGVVADDGLPVVATQHQATILKHATTAKPDNLLLIPERATFTLGDLMLFDIATAHAQHYLLAYLPSARMVLAEDHYVTELKTAKPRIYHDMVRFAQVLDELKLDVKTLVDIRGWRQFSMKEFRQWTRDFTPKTCPAGYTICVNG